jgi:mannose-1-phosphate guanylyltransferase
MEPIAVIMAGGLGLRLWPRSTERRPKQFVHVAGDGTLIQNTVMRLLPAIPLERIFVVTTQELAPMVQDQLPMIPEANILCEPFGRNTAPCLALATAILRHRFGDEIVCIALPSDHVIYNVREFQVVLDRACAAAEAHDGIVTIGVSPTRPEPGFGYIQVGDDIETDNPVLRGYVKGVTTFAEKPDVATAQRFIDAGDFVWNSGIFVARLGQLKASVDTYMPDHAPLFTMLDRHVGEESFVELTDMVYRQLRSVSFDKAVLEQAQNVIMVEGTFGWSDVGTWDEIYRLSMKDGRNNVVEGNVITVNTTNSYVSASSGRMVSLIGVDNLIVVETETTTMICPRGEAEQVRDLVDLLRRRNMMRNV